MERRSWRQRFAQGRGLLATDAPIPIFAQALAFQSLLSLVPFALLLTQIATWHPKLKGVQDLWRQILNAALVTPEIRETVTPWLDTTIGAVDFSGRVVPLVLLLCWSTWALLRTLFRALANVFVDSNARPSLQALISLGLTFALPATLGLVSLFWQEILMPRGMNTVGLSALSPYLIPFTIVLSLAATYRFASNSKLQWRPCILGGISVVLAWYLAARGFTWYAKRAWAVRSIYGTLATIPLFVLWTYLSWWLILHGALAARSIQTLFVPPKNPEKAKEIDLPQSPV